MPHSIMIPDSLWADAQERYDCRDPASRLRELLIKSFYIEENVIEMIDKNPGMFTTKRTSESNRYSRAIIDWTPDMIERRGTDPGVLIHSRYQNTCNVSGEVIKEGDLMVVYSLPGKGPKHRAKAEKYNVPPHLGPPYDRTGDNNGAKENVIF